ncbi:Tol-Pal system beta propeller repeat protein TolB [Halomonas urumqiensis]|uniref:Tol-Pal system protein TolB n=1 Tax=Halomonas urumqiensis TaxID=1684789 RepID=A0A2N7UER2_9GAMM|nr:Tol-Pal system beta propeller repeat protein TolB [Halomonas urumqiensis]PMR78938.1 Tol-Pal system beta propeller repeat protein TolB [Halomonas urumqiensis]PTB04157.1 Tol-Pal system protein TolB [Halomonas urumqiensis]GHE19575.1 protein TolB [Halomonas urumqiensis]
MKALMSAWLTAMLLLMSSVAHANLTIEITRGSDRATPIAVVPFAGGDELPEDVAQVIHDNLERSGYFDPLPRRQMFDQPSTSDDVRFDDWRTLDVRYLVVGNASQDGDGYRLQFELMDVSGERRMLGEVVTAGNGELRSAAHYISDQIFEAITDIRGAFSTRIAYVTANGVGDDMQFALYVADADGRNSEQILSSREPILSPAWSPDGGKLAYVSFETERPAIYIQDIGSGQRVRATSFEGINGAPAWSPDGRRLAMSLSKDGQPEIYVMDIAARDFQRITNNSAIDTEPSFSPDGRSLLFTSDRSGGPQIYRHDMASGEQERMTYTGNYNARGRFAPDGESIFLIHRSDRGYQVARQDLETDRLIVLSDSGAAESPSVAPNGTMVIFATQHGNSGVLGAVTADGRASFRLPSAQGDVREPAWSPFMN